MKFGVFEENVSVKYSKKSMTIFANKFLWQVGSKLILIFYPRNKDWGRGAFLLEYFIHRRKRKIFFQTILFVRFFRGADSIPKVPLQSFKSMRFTLFKSMRFTLNC